MKQQKRMPVKAKVTPSVPIAKPTFHKYYFLLLILVPLVLYFKVVFMDYTTLDDAIFISKASVYNSNLHNIGTSFQRGLFQPDANVYDYYRPIFLIDLILEYHLFGDNPAGYHLTNLLFHIVSVLLLFIFLKKIKIPPTNAFILSLLFAVHPVLSQAVAWIPGRNDMLLMIFFLSGFILILDYLRKPGWLFYAGQSFVFLISLFTKETAVMIPLLYLLFLITATKTRFKTILTLLAGWIGMIILFILIKSSVGPSNGEIPYKEIIFLPLHRWPALIQYLGKIIFPFNLSVFPMIETIPLTWGICAIALIIILEALSKKIVLPLIVFGLCWYLLFLFPVLIMPKFLVYQVYEHRLYIPVVGILIILSQTLLFSPQWKEKIKLPVSGIIILLFGIISFFRTDYFKNPQVFWAKAVEDSPNSGIARFYLAARTADSVRREQILLKAYEIDPHLKDINLYLGQIKFRKHQYDSATIFYKRQLESSKTSVVYMDLAHIYFEKNQLDSAASYLQKLIAVDPKNAEANSNLILLYFQTGQKEKALKVIDQMRQSGMEIPQQIVNLSK